MKNSKGTEKAQAKVNGQGEVRTEEEDRATLPTAGWRGQWGTVLSTAYPGIGWTLSAMGDSAELYLEGQHYQTCFKKKIPYLVAGGEQIARAGFFGEKRDGKELC